VVKRRFLAPTNAGAPHWLGGRRTMWITGFLLLGIVYYFGGGIFSWTWAAHI
jgi:uncharacterized membrane protein